jgi:hypothetical protein
MHGKSPMTAGSCGPGAELGASGQLVLVREREPTTPFRERRHFPVHNEGGGAHGYRQ